MLFNIFSASSNDIPVPREYDSFGEYFAAVIAYYKENDEANYNYPGAFFSSLLAWIFYVCLPK